MADTKISALPAASTPLTGSEVVPLNQSGVTSNVTVANLTAGRSVSALSYTATGGTGGNTALSLTSPSGAANYTGISQTGTTTGFINLFRASNNSGFIQLGVENSTGGNFITGNQAYSANIAGQILNFSADSGNTLHFTLDTGGNLIPKVAAKGINFTANTPASGMTSQLLNWYETGTWTPAIAPNVSGSITPSSVTGRYVRVGSLVTLMGTITVGSVSSPVGNVFINGFPFNTNVAPTGSIWLSGTNAFSGTPIMGINSTFAYVLYVDTTGTAQGTAGLYKSGTILTFNLIYTI